MVHKIDLVKEFSEKHMIDWKSEDVIGHFTKLFPETGEADASLVLSMSARSFLPENLAKNEVLRQKEEKIQEELKEEIKEIGETVIKEAYDIIDKQERFFK